MNLHELCTQSSKILKSAGIENAEYDAKLLVCAAAGIDEKKYFFNKQKELTNDEISAARSNVKRRACSEPLQYILGKWSFMGLEFFVDNRCLIPRQDTETLAELAIKIIKDNKYKTLLDICCGSGCIGLSVAKLSGVRVSLCDISEPALEITCKNAEHLEVSANVFKSDMFESVSGKFDVITINPPYLTKDEMQKIQKELTHEPQNALYGGDDGLFYYKVIKESVFKYLNAGGCLLMEIGENQGKDVMRLFPGCTVVKDLCGKDRVAVCCVT